MAEPDDEAARQAKALKAAMRAEALRRRTACAGTAGGIGAAPHLVRALAGEGPVAGYWPVRGEIDPRPAMEALAAGGRSLALPVVLGRGEPLGFRRYAPGGALVPAGYGLSVPAATEPVIPRMLIVPLLAFDRQGWRLGYGGGYYDRTLERLRAAGPVRAVGLAYAAQEVDAVPHDGHDQRLDLIVTEAGVIAPEGGPCD